MTEYSSPSSKEELISQFNDAVGQIQRLHTLWNECRYRRERGMLGKLRWALDSAFIELSADCKRVDGGDWIDKEDGFYNQIKKIDDDLDLLFKENKSSEVYKKLKEKEILLREVQDKAGKGAKLGFADDDFM